MPPLKNEIIPGNLMILSDSQKNLPDLENSVQSIISDKT
jgi:hypothetical protein